MSVVVLLLELLGISTRESEVSGPVNVKDEDASMVRVYGGPYEPMSNVVLPSMDVLRIHDTSPVLPKSTRALVK
jgi:hypothetical protein